MDLQVKEEQIKSPIDSSDKCFRIFTEPKSKEQYLCMTTGYSSTSDFKVGSTELETELDNVPELVKVLQHYDEERDIVWIPTIMSIPGKGMIFPEGSVGNWKWCFAKIVEIPEEDREKYPIPDKEGEYFDSRLDIDGAEKFANNAFHKACIAMGILTKDFTGSLLGGNKV